ncbi:MAG: DUF1015 domain-containing protein [Clostridia bacterium]|nr:DUF1015 domain-containing protein [Clostridia bacterium]
MTKWSVVACDQYTSEPKYWDHVKNTVGTSPSTFNMIFPEIYLEDDDADIRIKNINETMEKYLKDGVFKTLNNSLIYVERSVLCGKIRRGIVGSVDLEHYDYNKGSTSLIRATEGTVLERIPPRVKVRINASVELPHIMLLIDDEKDIVFNAINKDTSPVYDFDLMCNSGHIRGYKIDGEPVINALTELYNKLDGDNKLLFAVGDGNHSLATAKECWEQIKKGLTQQQMLTHPARFPLVEIVNIHDSSLEFEPIHRVVFGCNSKHLLDSLKEYYKECNNDGVGQKITFVINGNKEDIYIGDPSSQLTVGTLQNFLDAYIKDNNCKIDYIHGEDVVLELTKETNTIGFLLPPMGKSELFPTVIKDGSLPRKTFSMGEAWEKRFYLECKMIKQV